MHFTTLSAVVLAAAAGIQALPQGGLPVPAIPATSTLSTAIASTGAQTTATQTTVTTTTAQATATSTVQTATETATQAGASSTRAASPATVVTIASARPSASPVPTNGNVLPPVCRRAGCNGELCVANSRDAVLSPCIWKPEFSCYADANCSYNSTKRGCAWQESESLKTCLSDAAKEQ